MVCVSSFDECTRCARIKALTYFILAGVYTRMKKLFSNLIPYRVAITIALSLMLMELMVELIQPMLMAKIIDDGIREGNLSVVWTWGAVMAGLSLLAFVSGLVNSFYASHVSQSFGFDVREKLFDKIQSVSYAVFNRFPVTSLITRMTNDMIQLQNTIFMSLRIMMRAPLLIIGSTIMALLINAKLAFILIMLLPLLLGFVGWVMKKSSSLFRKVQEKVDSVNKVMQENLIGMRLIRAFLRRKHEVNRFDRSSEELKNKTVTALRMTELTMPVILLLMNIGIIVILWFGTLEVAAFGASDGDVVAIVLYAARITGVLSIISMIVMTFSRAKASAQRVVEVLEAEEDEAAEWVHCTDEPVQGKLTFDKVCFRYPDTNKDVLHEVSFTINPGETIAVLGATGSGKTSLFQLIPRLYEVTGGSIYLDDVNIQALSYEQLRLAIGYVPQEALLFTGTVEENIKWGKEDADHTEMIDAAMRAQIHETIMRMPKQYDTVLGQKGINLSGGQKQRLSIARALIRKPKLLLFDDSTSALDAKTEAQLLKALQEIQCTTLMITQKISTTIGANKVLLIKDGMLAAEGSHEQLMKSSRLYQQIVHSQFGEEDVPNA